ncbi:hypothetical protein ACIBAG_20140 [Streptomyces sp. NPDC051243]|uniref:hypothetical protein n=1 Tax=Streptomyces sp. NPDC051243 TaxID=3365646 RepID=UPI00379CAA71
MRDGLKPWVKASAMVFSGVFVVTLIDAVTTDPPVTLTTVSIHGDCHISRYVGDEYGRLSCPHASWKADGVTHRGRLTDDQYPARALVAPRSVRARVSGDSAKATDAKDDGREHGDSLAGPIVFGVLGSVMTAVYFRTRGRDRADATR